MHKPWFTMSNLFCAPWESGASPTLVFVPVFLLNAHKKNKWRQDTIYIIEFFFILLVTMDTIGTLIQTDTSNICLEKMHAYLFHFFFGFVSFLVSKSFSAALLLHPLSKTETC